jgi:hypothetical protein
MSANKLIINSFIVITLLQWGALRAQESGGAPAPVSPAQAMLESARELAQAGDKAGAIRKLEELAATGQASVSVITNDPLLSGLAGETAFDTLVAEMAKIAFPCEHDPAFDAFDFWVGEWDVHLADGSKAGTNSVRKEQHNCVVVERWQSARGGGGMSINYLDRAEGNWVQVWNDPSGNQIDIRGGLTDEGMLLEGSIHNVANGTTLPFRGLWTPLPDGRVRQYFEQADAGGTWTPWFEGFYSRRKDGG